MAEQILSLNKLAFRIGISRDVLVAVAKTKSEHYKPFSIEEKKRDGSVKVRRIDNPDKAIRKIQRRINKKILAGACKALPTYTTGSIPNRSTLFNARPHVGKQAMLLVDISDCFPSIHSSDVYDIYKKSLGCSPVVAKILTKLTTYGDRLPQGAPTSPSLCNLILAPLAQQLSKLAEKNDLVFTQYVDDLTFSGSYDSLNAIQSQAISIVEKHGFKVSRKKLKLVKSGERMEVTGLVVNHDVGVGRRYIRKVQRDIMKLKLDNPNVRGKISYVGSVSRSQGKKLVKRINKVLVKK